MEIWKNIPGYEIVGYEVSDEGRIRRKDLTGRWKFLKPGKDNNGRLKVALSKFGAVKRYQVHRLVLETFVGPAPEGMECRHLDGNHTNNKLINLTWGTHTENMQDKIEHGTHVFGEKHPHAKLTEADVREIRESKGTERELAQRYGVSQVAVHFIKTRKTWKHVA